MDFSMLAIIAVVVIALFFVFRGRNSPRQKPCNSGGSATYTPVPTPESMPMPPPPPQPQSETVVAMFFAPWCGHCKTMGPVWDQIMQQYDGMNGIRVVKINGDENPELCQLHGVQGFPTVKKCFRGLNNPEGVVYQGDRSMQDLINFLSQ